MGFSELALWARATQSLASDVPAGWQVDHLGELLTQTHNRVKVEPEKQYAMTGVKWYGEGIFLRETVTGKSLSASYVYPVMPGAFMYNRLFAWKASFAVVPTDIGEQYVSGEFPQFEVDQSRLLPEYLCLYVLSEKVMREVNRASAGSAAVSRNRLKEAKFLELEIPLPPLTTQQSIVRRWQELQAASIAANQEAETLERAAEREFLRGLGLNAPGAAKPRKHFAITWQNLERWGVMSNQHGLQGARLEDGIYPVIEGNDCIAEIIHGCSASPSPVPTTLQVLKISAVTRGVLDIRERKFAPDQTKLRRLYDLRKGDVLLCRTNGTLAYVGQSALVEQDMADLIFPDKVIRVRLRECMLPAFFWRLLQTPPLRRQIEAAARTAVGNYAIGGSDLWQLRLPLPPLEIQEALVSAIESARARAAQLRAEAARLQTLSREETEAAILGRFSALASPSGDGVESTAREPHHDHETTATPRPASEAVARRSSRRGQPAGGLSPAAGALRPELDGAGAGAGGPGAAARPADSTRPLDATRELATSAGSLTYTEISERLAVNIVRCLDDLLDAEPGTMAFSTDWLRDVHRRLAGELFQWAGQFRSTDVQVGTHFPPPAHAVAVQVRDFCLDLEERLRHLAGAESIADLLAWVDWRFQWIHPFKDFNGRVGRILLVALTFRLGLPPMDPAEVSDKEAYFTALRAADAGDPAPLREIWLRRLGN